MVLGKEGNTEVVLLTSEDARGWALFPAALIRIYQFCKRYDSDADAAMMVAQMKQAFVHPKPSAFVIVMVEDGYNVVGHLLVTIEEWFGTRTCSIVQYETDKALNRRLADVAFHHVEEWAKKMGAGFMQAMARNSMVAKAFQRFYGMRPTRVMMRKSLSTGVADTAPAV